MKKENNLFVLAICEIPFRESDYAVAVKVGDKVRAEEEMEKAYDCWNNPVDTECIILGHTPDTITCTPYGDFIEDWLRAADIPFNEEIGLIMLDSYCAEVAPENCEDSTEWYDERITMYWFEKELLENYLAIIDETLEHYLNSYTYDDVECDILQNVPYCFELTVME